MKYFNIPVQKSPGGLNLRVWSFYHHCDITDLGKNRAKVWARKKVIQQNIMVGHPPSPINTALSFNSGILQNSLRYLVLSGFTTASK